MDGVEAFAGQAEGDGVGWGEVGADFEVELLGEGAQGGGGHGRVGGLDGYEHSLS